MQERTTRKPRTNAATNDPAARAPQTGANGGAIAPTGSGEIAPLTGAEAAFKQYAETRDEFLNTPFAHNTSLAKAGSPFTLLKIADRIVEPNEINRAAEPFEAVVFLVELQDEYQHVNPTTGEVQTYPAGTKILISMTKNGIRIQDQNHLTGLLADYGPIPNLTLQEYPSRKAGFSNPIGIVHKDTWRTVQQIAKERGLIK